MNSVNIIGRLTKEPEPRSTQNGTVMSFCLAVDRNDKNRNTDFIDCVAFGNTAEFISRNFHKGDPVAITGKLQTRTWERDNGIKQKISEVYVTEASFVPRTGNNTAAGGDINFG